jgi:hypothetical protein
MSYKLTSIVLALRNLEKLGVTFDCGNCRRHISATLALAEDGTAKLDLGSLSRTVKESPHNVYLETTKDGRQSISCEFCRSEFTALTFFQKRTGISYSQESSDYEML